MTEIDYTVIIPHKNIPHLLVRCLDSIPLRENVQVIVADDNSDISEINGINLLSLPEKYLNVEFIWGKNKNERKGAGYARNLGLDRAKGKWLIFADADDFFMPCFNEALDQYKDYEDDIIFFKVTSVDSNTLQPATRHQYIINNLEQIQKNKNWDLAYELHSPWGKFIKRNIIEVNNFFFREIPVANDVYFGVQTIAKATLKSISEKEIYCITSRTGSLMTQHSVKSLKIRFNEIYKVNIYLKKEGSEYYLNNLLIHWAFEINKISILQSIVLLPKLVKTCGISLTKECIKRLMSSKIKRFVN